MRFAARRAFVARRWVAFRTVVLAALIVLIVTPAAQGGPIGGFGEKRWGISYDLGFDTCTAPTKTKMQDWWNYSPYWDIGIYIAGVNRCDTNQPNLSQGWAKQVHSMGWSYYLINVGLQAPCSTLNVQKMSSDPTTAYNQGQTAANNVVGAASDLGFTGINVYYFDMEDYDTTNTTCRNAVNAFIDGWADQITDVYGEKAAAYGSSCGSAVSDWWTSTSLRNVWAADWNNVRDVFGLNCVSDSIFDSGDKLRLHQYRGGHVETWAGVSINIDNDCARGKVTPEGHGVSDPICQL
jgi:hypothetical protein